MSPAAISNSKPAPAHDANIAPKSSATPVMVPSTAVKDTAASSLDRIPAWVKPDLTRLLRVEHLPGSFTSRSVSLVDLPVGAVFARITNPTPATCAYSSVQVSRDLHIELNCDLVYINHSCRPTLVFDMARWEVRVNPDLKEGLKAGDELTFFYPSTEWSMAQPFECRCGEKECHGMISGAKDTPHETLQNYWLNQHIEELLQEQHSKGQ